MIRKATIDDLDQVYDILKMGRELHKNLNINQWTLSFFKYEEIKAIIEEFYLNIIDGRIAGVMYIHIGEDPDYKKIDGSWLNNDREYMVIHRVATHCDFYKRGVAKELITYALDYAKKNKIKSVRIDTHPDNLPMQKTIANFNFTKCGIIYINGKYERYAYENII